MKKILYIISMLSLVLLACACTKSENDEANMGYLMLGVETNTVLSTKAGVANVPGDYKPKQLHVEVISAAGETIASTDDFDNDTNLKGKVLMLAAGQYTVKANSNNWDGTGSGVDAPFYYGETTVTVQSKTLTTANVTCTQANVKVTVNFSDTFRANFATATSTIESAISGVNSVTYTMGTAKGSSYFPVSDLRAILAVSNKQNESHSMVNTITGVKARDHYILNYTVAPAGSLGGVTVNVDPDGNTYSYEFHVPRKASTALAAYTANAWSTFAYLEGAITSKKSDFDNTKLTLQYKLSTAADWTTVQNSALTVVGDKITYTLKGLTPSTSYVYRLAYTTDADEVLSGESTFTTEAQPVLYNGGFELWHQDGKPWYPNEAGVTFWDTSNVGSTTISASDNGTTQDTSIKHGGASSAKLQCKYVVIKFAAASLYTGEFDHLVGTKGAVLNWGIPFTGRPTSLHGFMMYSPGNVNRVGSGLPAGAPAKGEPDQCAIYWALLTSRIQVDNTDIAGTFPNFETDSRVIGYGPLPVEKCVNTNDQWVEFNIPLTYYDLTKKPAYLLIVNSASRYGDYFHGSENSCLHLDDFELIYGDDPVSR